MTVIEWFFVTLTPAASVVVYAKLYVPCFKALPFVKSTDCPFFVTVTSKFSLALFPTVLLSSSSTSVTLTKVFNLSFVKVPSEI